MSASAVMPRAYYTEPVDTRVAENESGKHVAVFSRCRTYRYYLSRVWDPGEPLINYLMLNPSTATELVNDPTLHRCEQRARRRRYGGMVITNIFAYRSTDPRGLRETPKPVGDHANYYIRKAAKESELVICGWGVHGGYLNRGAEVAAILHELGVCVCALKLTRDGFPRHPLYVGYEVEPIEYRPGIRVVQK